MKTGGRKHPSASGRAPAPSIARRVNGKLQITAFNATRHLRPTCGATAKSTGEQCRDIAMANGKCFRHGGRTPKGKNWHLPVWPDRDAPGAMDKVNRKLRDLQKAARKRERRVATMSDEERADYEKWKRAHKPGSPADRARARAQRKQNAEARAMIERMQAPPSPPSDAAAGLAEAREFLRKKSEAIARRQAAQDPKRDDDPTNAFQGAFS